MGNNIYNLDGLPFKNEAVASRMRELLSNESGKKYAIEQYPDGGFVLLDVIPASGVENSLTPIPPAPRGQKGAGMVAVAKPQANQLIKLRPAIFRTNLTLLGLMVISAACVIFAEVMVGIVLIGISLEPAILGDWYHRIITSIVSLGSISLACVWLVLIWKRISALYLITDFGVEARQGIIAQQTVGLRFQDIRSMSIKQSVLDRLLNVGLLEFTSAGTDGIPVQFKAIANPNKVLQWVKGRMTPMSSED